MEFNYEHGRTTYHWISRYVIGGKGCNFSNMAQHWTLWTAFYQSRAICEIQANRPGEVLKPENPHPNSLKILCPENRQSPKYRAFMELSQRRQLLRRDKSVWTEIIIHSPPCPWRAKNSHGDISGWISTWLYSGFEEPRTAHWVLSFNTAKRTLHTWKVYLII